MSTSCVTVAHVKLSNLQRESLYVDRRITRDRNLNCYLHSEKEIFCTVIYLFN